MYEMMLEFILRVKPMNYRIKDYPTNYGMLELTLRFESTNDMVLEVT